MSIVQIHAALSKLCCVSMPMLHVHVHNACPCPCCMSMSMLLVHVNIHVHIYRNAGMPDCPTSSQSGTGLKKTNMPKQVRYRTKLTLSGIFLVRYRTRIRDAGMPMPALVSLLPMPSSENLQSAMDHLQFIPQFSDYFIINKKVFCMTEYCDH
jgi:hypothetical protein